MVQTSLKSACYFEGIGIHSGKQVLLKCLPAEPNTGIVFIRTDLRNQSILVSPEHVVPSSRYTSLREGSIEIRTPEHVLAACSGLGISNLRIEINAEEVPILDGSALLFVTEFQRVGLQTFSEVLSPLVITTPIVVQSGDASVIALPSDRPQFSYVLSYPQSFIGSQIVTTYLENFAHDIAPARTYGFYAEVQALLARGLAQGGGIENAVIIGEDGYLSELRFPDELARHKLLDLMGDLWILGRPIVGHVIGVKSGHALNATMVQQLHL